MAPGMKFSYAMTQFLQRPHKSTHDIINFEKIKFDKWQLFDKLEIRKFWQHKSQLISKNLINL